MKIRKWLCVLVLLAGLASGLTLPRLLSTTPARAEGGYCYNGICYVRTASPTSVLVWIAEDKQSEMYLNVRPLDQYRVALEANPR